MTLEEKIKYFTIAAAIVGFNFKDKDIDLLVNTYDLILVKGETACLRDLAGVKARNEEMFKEVEQEPVENASEEK